MFCSGNGGRQGNREVVLILTNFHMPPQLEIACFSLESAILAAKAGADRLELCANLEEGGTTPDSEMVKGARQKISIPIFLMIRPRGGNFVYSNTEFEQMKTEISVFKSLNADGFGFGILDGNNEIDIKRNSELVELASPLPCTFHRAFDKVSDYKKSLEQVISCGFKTILTSGLANSALEGMDTLTELVKLAGNRIDIMPGGGIRSKNIAISLNTKSGFYHSSAIIDNCDMANEKEILALKTEILNVDRKYG